MNIFIISSVSFYDIFLSFLGLMIATMRTILEEILPKMNYEKEKTEEKIISKVDNERNLNIDSKNIQNNDKILLEFYPHMSPKLSDSWDFQSQLLGVTFPSDDSENITKWTKETRKIKNFQKNDKTTFCSKNIRNDNKNKGEKKTRSFGSELNSSIQSFVQDSPSEIYQKSIMNPSVVTIMESSIIAPKIHDITQTPISAHTQHIIPTATTHVNVPTPDQTPVPVPTPDQTPVPVPTPDHTSVPAFVPNPVPVPVPTLLPFQQSDVLDLGTLTIQLGEFTKIYSHSSQQDQFDVVVTCFFIDTATDILEYIAVIGHVLRKGDVLVVKEISTYLLIIYQKKNCEEYKFYINF